MFVSHLVFFSGVKFETTLSCAVVGVVAKVQMDLQSNPDCTFNKPTLLRSLFTVGLLCKNFDFDSDNFGEKKVGKLFGCYWFPVTFDAYLMRIFYMQSKISSIASFLLPMCW